MKGRLTYIAEGNDNPHSIYYSKKLRVDSRGGLVIGRGYRLYEKTDHTISYDMQTIGLNPKAISILRRFHKAKGIEAKAVVEKVDSYIHLTHEQETKLFEKEYEASRNAIETFLLNNMHGYGTQSFDYLPQYQQEILIDFYYAGHFDLKIQNLILTALGRCTKSRTNDAFNELVNDVNLWRDFDVNIDRIKYRMIYVKENNSFKDERIEKVFGVPRDVISGLILKKPDDYVISGFQVDYSAGEFLLIVKHDLTARDSKEKQHFDGVNLNDLFLCLKILYDDTIKNKMIGISHVVNHENPADSVEVFRKVVYPDILENKSILHGTKMEQDLIEAIDTIHELAYNDYPLSEFDGGIHVEPREKTKELRLLNLKALQNQSEESKNSPLKALNSERMPRDTLKNINKTVLDSLRQKNDILLLKSMLKKNDQRVSFSPLKGNNVITSSISSQRAFSVQKSRGSLELAFNGKLTDRPISPIKGSNHNNRGSVAFLPSTIVSSTSDISASPTLRNRKYSSSNINTQSPIKGVIGSKDEILEGSPERLSKQFVQLPHNTLHVSTLNKDEFVWMNKVTRLWVKPKEVAVIDCTLNNNLEYFYVKEACMKFEPKQVKRLDPGSIEDINLQSSNNPAAKFIAKWPEISEKVGKRFPCLQRLEQITRAWAMAYRIYKKGIPLDLELLQAQVDRHSQTNTLFRNSHIRYQSDENMNSYRRSLSIERGMTRTSARILDEERPVRGSKKSKSGVWKVGFEEGKLDSERRRRLPKGLEAHLVGIMIGFGDEVLKSARIEQKKDKRMKDRNEAAQSLLKDQMLEERTRLQKEIGSIDKGAFKISFPLIRKECCAVCQTMLNFTEVYYAVGGEFFCRLHHPKSCSNCFKLTRGEEVVKVGEKIYHKECMVCNRCGKSLSTGKSYRTDNYLVHVKCSELYLVPFSVSGQVESQQQVEKPVIKKPGLSTLKHFLGKPI